MQDYIPREKDINEQIEPVTVKQYDNNSRFLHVKILDKDVDNDLFDLSNCEASLYIQPKGNEDPTKVAYVTGEASFDEENGGIATFLLPGSVTKNVGEYECEIHINEGNIGDYPHISTPPFTLTVNKSIRNDEAIMASSQFSALDKWASNVQNLKTEMNVLVAMASDGDITVGTADSEIANARVGYNNVVYDTLGDAVRIPGEIIDTKISSVMKPQYVSMDPEEVIDGKFLTFEGTMSSFNTYQLHRYVAEPNKTYKITTAYGGNACMYAFANANGVIIMRYPTERSQNIAEARNVTSPPTAAFLYVNFRSNNATLNFCSVQKVAGYLLDSDKVEKLAAIEEILISAKEALANTIYTPMDLEIISDSYIRYTTDTLSQVTDEYSNAYQSTVIPVHEGEIYRITCTYASSVAGIYLADNGKNKISTVNTTGNTHTTITEYEIKIPQGAAFMGISGRTDYAFIVKQGINQFVDLHTAPIRLARLGFDAVNWRQRVIDEQKKNDFAWKEFDKGYVTFCVDDGNRDMDEVANLFEQNHVPLCCAVIPDRLNQLTVGGETIQEVCERVVTEGGEILAHNAGILDANSTDADFERFFVQSKMALTEAGFQIDGIILSGDGTNAPFTVDFDKCVRYMRPYYQYSDAYGRGTGVVQYDHARTFTNRSHDIANTKLLIDNAMRDKSWISIAFHGLETYGDASEEIIQELIDYIRSLGNDRIEFTTFRQLHENFGTTTLENRLTAIGRAATMEEFLEVLNN